MNKKISSRHLERKAMVYLRQSSLGQLERNTESTKRQYALKDRAVELGWDVSQVVVLDSDLGKSGTSMNNRGDFQSLIASVGVGEAGAVFAIEASRFSRSQADWHRLVDICALTDTLIVDHDGVYDPNDFNDRVLLGFKGTWSHTELHGMKVRLQGAKLNKAKRGALRCRPPSGYWYNFGDNFELFYDESVTSCVKMVFRKFKEFRSAYQVARYFGENNIKFPNYSSYRPGAYAVIWMPLTYGRVLSMLKNPAYAGVYCYGKTSQRTEVIEGVITKRRCHAKKAGDQPIYLKNAHPAFISHEEYEENLRILKANDLKADPMARHGTPKRGRPLLQGLVICGQCGRRMIVRYQGTGGSRPTYVCQGARRTNPYHGECWSVVNSFVDQALIEHIFTLLTEEKIDQSLQIFAALKQDLRDDNKEWQTRIERAQYEADKAFRQYDAVDPSNRLAARSLEARWNERLRDVDELKERFQKNCREHLLEITDEQRKEIMHLARNLRSVFNAPSTTPVDQKQILELLVKQVSLSPVDLPTRLTKITILWHSGATTSVVADRPRGNVINRTAPEILAKIRELADDHTDSEIADKLNGMSVPSRHTEYTQGAVSSLRAAYGIQKLSSDPSFSVKGEIYMGRYISITGLAKRLNIDRQVVRYWINCGVLKAVQHALQAPWWVEIDRKSMLDMHKRMRFAEVNEKDILTLVEECAE